MKSSFLATLLTTSLFSAVVAATTSEPLRIGVAASEIVRLENHVIELNELSYCNVTYLQPPFSATCFAGISIKDNGNKTLLKLGVMAGASADIRDGIELHATAGFAAEFAVFEKKPHTTGLLPWDYEIAKKAFPADGSVQQIDADNLDQICVSDVLKYVPELATQILRELAEVSGSDVCIGVRDIERDDVNGLRFKLYATVDLLNDSIQKGPMSNDLFIKVRNSFGLPAVHAEVDLGARLLDTVRISGGAAAGTHIFRRSLASPSDAAADFSPVPYLTKDGAFAFGSLATPVPEKSNNIFAVVSIALVVCAAVVALIAGAAFVYRRRTNTNGLNRSLLVQ